MKIEITTQFGSLQAESGSNLAEILTAHGLKRPCGGKGICGKCLVEVNGRKILACRTQAEENMTVILPEEQAFDIASESEGISFPLTPADGLGAAVDIGTTTVVLYLIDLKTGQILSTESEPNAQRVCGADVISRIAWTMEHGLTPMVTMIREQVDRMLKAALGRAGADRISVIAAAGNTVMQHFYAGLDASPIAAAPFTPRSLFGVTENNTFLSPCLAGYVGGDITSGLMSTGAFLQEKPCLFLDLGTNGEMALGGRDGFVCCAAAAGPAFEAGNISCGSPAVSGAVCHVGIRDGRLYYETVENAPPASLCGSGLIDLAASLLELGIIDETGRLLPPDELDAPPAELEETGQGVVFRLNKSGTVFLTAGDVRQLQLAKAAVAAGICVLLDKAGLSMDDVETVYLAGGFGSFLSPDSALKIGLLPPCDLKKIRAVGNSSGRGMIEWLRSKEAVKALQKTASLCRYLELSSEPGFQDYYMDCMFFGEEAFE